MSIAQMNELAMVLTEKPNHRHQILGHHEGWYHADLRATTRPLASTVLTWAAEPVLTDW